MAKLNQVIAIATGVKANAESETTKIYHTLQKEQLFEGFAKIYHPESETGIKLPPESKIVQYTVREQLRMLRTALSQIFTVDARRDYTNVIAKADVKLKDGTVLVKDAPVPYLLSLEKKLVDLETCVSKIPVLSSDKEWKLDATDGLWKTEISKTHRQEKSQEAIVLYPATTEHPAQTQLITKDVLVGYWHNAYHSGAIALTERQALVDRVREVLQAVVQAREEANMIEEADIPDAATAIFEYIFPTKQTA